MKKITNATDSYEITVEELLSLMSVHKQAGDSTRIEHEGAKITITVIHGQVARQHEIVRAEAAPPHARRDQALQRGTEVY